MSMSIVCTELGFAWPDGTVVFDELNLAVGSGRSGLICVNGAGKSTLLRLIAGELAPTRGSVQVAGELGYLPQHLTLDADRPVDDVLGIAPVRAALLAIERGDTSEAHFTAVGDDWDVEERARATLDRLGLGHVDLDRRVGQLSGGESILLGLAAQFLRRPDVLLLDEPTNNLDLDARRRLYAAVAAWPGVLVVVSHDRELLELVGQIADLSDGEVRWYGGDLSAYEEAVAVEPLSRAARPAPRSLLLCRVRPAGHADRRARRRTRSGGRPDRGAVRARAARRGEPPGQQRDRTGRADDTSALGRSRTAKCAGSEANSECHVGHAFTGRWAHHLHA